jgi:hypothetical protein
MEFGFQWLFSDRITLVVSICKEHIVDNTSRSSIATKTKQVFQPLQVLSNTYCERMDPIQSSLLDHYQASSDY